MIALLCGVKISAVHHLVLSQYMHLIDRRTDRQTELRQQFWALHYMQLHGKNYVVIHAVMVNDTCVMDVFLYCSLSLCTLLA